MTYLPESGLSHTSKHRNATVAMVPTILLGSLLNNGTTFVNLKRKKYFYQFTKYLAAANVN
jgi:hypothetical protein